MELDLQILFGLHVHSCTHWLRTRNPPPRIWAQIRGRHWSAKIDDVSFLWPASFPAVFSPISMSNNLLHLYRLNLAWARICRSFKETRYRFSAWRAGTKPYLSYWPAKLRRLAKSITRNRFLGYINVYKYEPCLPPPPRPPPPVPLSCISKTSSLFSPYSDPCLAHVWEHMVD
jgi:hypothetical protein